MPAVTALIGAVVGIIGTASSLRSTGSKKHVDRAQSAAALLTALEALPPEELPGKRLVTHGDDNALRSELARILRENAAAYALQHPTPVGVDFLRLLVPVYSLLFAVIGADTTIESRSAVTHTEWVSLCLLGLVFLSLALSFAIATALLWWRMVKRNASRALAGTPGTETFLVTVPEIIELYRSQKAKRRAREPGEG
ncbi:hypothetical protein [Curtobacterium sp. MMLR14_010]|uniref:hypothetical protein n=1 Tax=Curtobacterium sp. MMLR14_010 TaxID=1898743 RepID=UPI0011144435|nr:hypothetical protein [Curtobacterium sp. MMLR14_010]